MSIDEVNANLQRVEMQDESFEEYIKAHTVAPIVAMTKYKEPFDDLNPSLKVDVKSLHEHSAEDPLKILETYLLPIPKAFPDYKVVTKPKVTKLAGLKSAHVSLDYNLRLDGGRILPTRLELWIVPRGKLFFVIGTGTRQDERTGKRAEIQKIIESIKIDPDSAREQSVRAD
jgi:hypothetical protein